MKQNLFIIGCNGVPARYGGFETFAEQISIKLSPDYIITIVCSRKLYNTKEPRDIWNNLNRIFINLKANGIQSILYDLLSFRIALKNAEQILVLGVTASLFLAFVSAEKRQKIFVHVDGLEWTRSKWNVFAKAILYLAFRMSLRYAHCILIDSSALLKYIPVRYKYKTRSVSYGGDHVNLHRAIKKKTDRPFALAIARAEPENNLHIILSAFEKDPPLELVIISNWHKTRYGRSLFRKYSQGKNIRLIQAIYDESELSTYRNYCSVYIHGHNAGGTNPSLVEAMYSGIPVIAWDNSFNRITTNNLANYFKSKTELLHLTTQESLSVLSRDALKLQAFAFKNYTWQMSADIMKNVLENHRPNLT